MRENLATTKAADYCVVEILVYVVKACTTQQTDPSQAEATKKPKIT